MVFQDNFGISIGDFVKLLGKYITLCVMKNKNTSSAHNLIFKVKSRNYCDYNSHIMFAYCAGIPIIRVVTFNLLAFIMPNDKCYHGL